MYTACTTSSAEGALASEAFCATSGALRPPGRATCVRCESPSAPPRRPAPPTPTAARRRRRLRARSVRGQNARRRRHEPVRRSPHSAARAPAAATEAAARASAAGAAGVVGVAGVVAAAAGWRLFQVVRRVARAPRGAPDARADAAAGAARGRAGPRVGRAVAPPPSHGHPRAAGGHGGPGALPRHAGHPLAGARQRLGRGDADGAHPGDGPQRSRTAGHSAIVPAPRSDKRVPGRFGCAISAPRTRDHLRRELRGSPHEGDPNLFGRRRTAPGHLGGRGHPRARVDRPVHGAVHHPAAGGEPRQRVHAAGSGLARHSASQPRRIRALTQRGPDVAEDALAHGHAVLLGRRPQPQLRLLLGRGGRELGPVQGDIRRLGALLGARDVGAGRLRLVAAQPPAPIRIGAQLRRDVHPPLGLLARKADRRSRNGGARQSGSRSGERRRHPPVRSGQLLRDTWGGGGGWQRRLDESGGRRQLLLHPGDASAVLHHPRSRHRQVRGADLRGIPRLRSLHQPAFRLLLASPHVLHSTISSSS